MADKQRISGVHISVRTHKDIGDWETGRRILQALWDTSDRLAPERASIFWANPKDYRERGIAISSPDDLRDRWSTEVHGEGDGKTWSKPAPIHWRRRAPTQYDAEARRGFSRDDGAVIPSRLSLHAKAIRKVDWYGLFVRWCEIADPFLGFVTLGDQGPGVVWREGDRVYSSRSVTMKNYYRMGESYYENDELVIGALPWAMFWGEGFLDFLDWDGLEKAGFAIQPCASGSILRLTDSAEDVLDRLGDVFKARERAETFAREGLIAPPAKPKPMTREENIAQISAERQAKLDRIDRWRARRGKT